MGADRKPKKNEFVFCGYTTLITASGDDVVLGIAKRDIEKGEFVQVPLTPFVDTDDVAWVASAIGGNDART